MAGSPEGAVVGEVGRVDLARSLSVRPGEYFVRGRGDDVLCEGAVTLGAGSTQTVDPKALQRGVRALGAQRRACFGCCSRSGARCCLQDRAAQRGRRLLGRIGRLPPRSRKGEPARARQLLHQQFREPRPRGSHERNRVEPRLVARSRILSRRWRTLLARARETIRELPGEELGKCVLSDSGRLFTGDAETLGDALGRRGIRFHAGSIRGALPTLGG